jgi:hypothetical protein
MKFALKAKEAEEAKGTKGGKFHDQGDAKWIVTRGQFRGHNDTPFGRPIGNPGVGRPTGVFCMF